MKWRFTYYVHFTQKGDENSLKEAARILFVKDNNNNKVTISLSFFNTEWFIHHMCLFIFVPSALVFFTVVE